MPARSIRVATYASINGEEHWVTIRGKDTRNPAMLILGGPGAALSTMTPFFAPWEEALTLVQWDQPGAGSTYAKNGMPRAGSYTIERLTRDAIAVAEFATDYLQTEKLLLLGCSGGSIVGLHVAAQRPDLLDAYVGCGQVVHWANQMRLSYELLLSRAKEANDAQAIADLEGVGPPPWRSIDDEVTVSRYSGAQTDEERAALADLEPGVLAGMRSPPRGADYIAEGVEIGDQRARATVLYERLRDEIGSFDAWQLGTAFRIPMFFLQGEFDAMTVTSEVARYAAGLDAPHVELVSIAGASHAGFYLRDEFLRLLKEVVLGHLSGEREA